MGLCWAQHTHIWDRHNLCSSARQIRSHARSHYPTHTQTHTHTHSTCSIQQETTTMLFSRTTALVAMSLFAAGMSGVSAKSRSTVNPTLARKVKSFKFCSRPVIDSVSFQPIVYFDSESNTNTTAGIPVVFFPYVGQPAVDIGGGTFPYWGAFGNVMQADFGFKSPMVDCDSAADGDFNSTSLGTMVGTCKSIATPINATELFEEIFNGDVRRRLQDGPVESAHVTRHLQEQLLALYIETELYCTWKAIFNAPKTKAGEKTVLSGSSLRTALEAEQDFVDGRTGLLSGSKPLFVSSEVQIELPQRGRMLQEEIFATAYTEYTVTYGHKFGGWNPFYVSSNK